MARNINLTIDFDTDLELYINDQYPDIKKFVIKNKSLDARKANKGRKPKYQYTILDITEENISQNFELFNVEKQYEEPIIIGAGPAGLFCALRLLDHGVKSKIFERGGRSIERMNHISKFWRYGELDEDSNVCFGEGGAGLFSDGKLITRIKSPHIAYVMNKLVMFGAPPEIEYLSNPHLGSNKMRKIIPSLVEYLKSKGCQVNFNSKVCDIIFDDKKNATGVELINGTKIHSNNIVVATGHSAHNIYKILENKKVSMEQKDFAIGVRMEHPRQYINKMQYGNFFNHPDLETAKYSLTYNNKKTNRGVYSFCMCPGGYVLSSGTEKDGLVTNGMSNYKRNSPWSNSAIIVSVKKENDFGSDSNLLQGIELQRSIEKKAHQLSKEMSNGVKLPSIRITDFLEDKSSNLTSERSSSPSGIFTTSLNEIFPKFVINHLKKALVSFNHKMEGIISKSGMLIAPETRTSSPVRILRDKENLQSVSNTGLYPCGEGSGHAGGITSAAVDGVKVAVQMATQINQ